MNLEKNSPDNSSPNEPSLETAPGPAAKEIESKFSLSWEIKRLMQSLEAEVSALDWSVGDRFGTVPELSGPATHLLSAGGKRVRPLLVNLLCRSLQVPFDKLKLCAVAGELVHTATLLHDDILDGATVRRGKIAAHLKYGSHTTVLSGDALLSKAISDIATLNDPEVLKRLADTVRELVEGECLQADLEGKVHADYDLVLEVARRKTASLFAWCAWVTGHFAKCHQEDLFRFGTHLGIAFQLLDDVLDWEGTDTGKTLYQDLFEAKLNSLGVTLVRHSTEAESLLKEAFRTRNRAGNVEGFTRLGTELKLVPEYGFCLNQVRKEANLHSDFCLGYLQKLPPSEWRDLAHHLVGTLLKRNK